MPVEIYTKSNCQSCLIAKQILARKGIDYLEVDTSYNALSKKHIFTICQEKLQWKSESDVMLPQILIDNYHIGSLDELYDPQVIAQLAQL